MSKLLSRLLAALLAISVMAMGLAVSRPEISLAQQQAVSKGVDRNQTIVAATAEVLEETSAIRGLPVLRSVRSGAQSRAEIERMLVSKLSKQVSPQEMHAIEQSLKKLGLVPTTFTYQTFMINLLTEQVAGYYDPIARQFHLADWIELDGQKPVMAHELTHALQDQHFNLRRFENWPHGDSDAELAAHALVEGDATLAMMYYLSKQPSRALAFVRSFGSNNVASKQFDQAPRALRETLIFPYTEGMEWATRVHQRGGWEAISKAYSRLPESTEQILHVEKYFSGERPLKVRLPDLAGLLNDDGQQLANSKQQTANSRRQAPSAAVGSRRSAVVWRQIETDVNGEWGYYLILDEFLKSPAVSKRAAAGWAGDRYALYERSASGELFLVQVSQWDTVEDAREFFDAYVKRTVLRYPEGRLVTEQQNETADTIRQWHRWQTREGGVLIELRGLKVLLLEGIPEDVSSDIIVDQLGR